MIYYSEISEYTQTASPQPHFVATYGRRIELAYDPDLGFWIPNWPEELGEQPSAATVLAWVPPAPDPGPTLTDVEIATGNFKAARIAAPEYLDGLKGTVWAALKAGGMSPNEATAAGVALVLLHAAPLAAFESAGGHPDAGLALYTAIASQESVAALPWLTEGILAIFAAALAPAP